MAPITTVIWDLGGVLVRTEDSGPRQALADRLGLTRSELEALVFGNEADYRGQLGEIDSRTQWLNVLQQLGQSSDSLEKIRSQFFGGDFVDSSLVAYIRSLRSRYKTGLLSNALSDLRDIVTKKWQIADAFDDLVISAEVGLMKPDRQIYQLALERLGSEPEQAVFIDDSSTNVLGAHSVGIPCDPIP